MAAPRTQFDRFLRALHRRFMVLRLAEYAALGLLAGCAAALPLVSMLLWSDRPALPLAIATLALGTTAGVVVGVARRPGLFDTAAEVDRQLGLSDLLATALTLQNRSPSLDPWDASVIAVADARCHTLAPRDVLLHRLSPRGWGGIGLATALVLSLALLSTQPGAADAGGTPPLIAGVSPNAVNFPDRPYPLRDAGNGGRSVSRRGANDPVSDETNLDEATKVSVPDAGQLNDLTPANPSRGGSDAGGTDGSGQGAGASRAPLQNTSPRAVPPFQASTRRSSPGAAGVAAGAGAASPESSPGDASAGPLGRDAGSADPLARPTPPWQSSDWPADVRAAQAAIDAGQIPDAYRDLVRDYFDRP